MISKQTIALSLCALSIFALGCKKQEIDEPLERSYETYVGELKSLGGIKVDKSITHLFENEDGMILYAYSDRYDLADKEYVLKEIEAYGVVMSFENVDKDVFEIRRISEPSDKDEEEDEVKLISYKNSDLGFQLDYPNNWEMSEFYDSVKITAPIELNEDEEEDPDAEPDYVIVARMEAGLSLTSDDELADRASEIRDYVRAHYDHLIGVTSELSYIGEDSQFAVVYKPVGGDQSYFVPSGADLIELSFYHPGEDEKISNFNVFSEMVNSFRFLPNGESEEKEDTKEEEEEEEEEEVQVDDEEEELAQVMPAGYREFESNPYHFSIAYPTSWYYSGGNGGYDFADEPLEDGIEPSIRLDLSTSGTEGRTETSKQLSITVLVDDRYYTLTGNPSYGSVMEEMADSIRSTSSEEE